MRAPAFMPPIPRVLQVVLSLAPGGTERLVIELVNRLRPSVPMAVCCLDTLGQWGEELRATGIEVCSLNRAPGFHPGLGRHIAAAAARHGATVVHAHQYSPFVYSALARLWNPRVRVVFTEHGRLSDAPPSARRRIANSALSRLPFESYAVSADLKRHLVSEGFHKDAVGVIYNGIDLGPRPSSEFRREIRRELVIADDTLVVGTIARLDPVKDLATLIAATAALNRERPALLLLIGDGPERARLERAAADADGGRSTRFLGHRDDARRWLAGCDVFANSSISEGVSLTILEGMAAGLPVVATRVGGTPEVVDDASGILVPARDPRAMIDVLRELATVPQRRAALGDGGRHRVETHFTLDRMVHEYHDAYRRAAAA